MGSHESEGGGTAAEKEHSVVLTKGFWMGKTTVTQGQWKALMGNNPSNFNRANLPVETESWNEAMAFCKKLTDQERAAGQLAEGYEYTLPTEAQWEYACRAGSTKAHSGDLDLMA